ncbi:MAG: phenylalanine--tRNA ligase beta subunit-related protein [Planctomycetota bacterium]|nr:phenylalanine--tRNA ligase beta subunit-related protein [Planctomycetota bacterium]
MPDVTIDQHPELDARIFVTRFPDQLGNLSAASEFSHWFDLQAAAPLQTSDEVRAKVRELFRLGGFKPTGRNKPASEYLVRAANENRLASINPAVDFCNIVSLHSGLPISVIDLSRSEGDLSIRLAEENTTYVFNASGQEIDVGKLICLFDSRGPCANAIKDSQRTKTADLTTETLSVIWGTRQLPGRSEEANRWYQELLSRFGAELDTIR